MKLLRILAVCCAVALAAVSFAAEPTRDGGWSADLLSQILKAEPGTAQAPATAEMVLHTYHLTHLRVGEAGKPQNVVAILHKLLPAGSSMNSDVPANSLHVLTTPGAHKAVWEYLSAVDIAEPAAASTVGAVPDEVKAALKKLAETGEQSSRVLAAVNALQTDVSRQFASIDARQRRQTLRLAGGSAAFILAVAGALFWTVRRRTVVPSEPSAALALMPDQVATALTPVHERMRNDVLGLLNEVAIKLQAQHTEQQKLVREQQTQLEDARQALATERRQFITDAGTMVVQAVERVDATTAKLAKQQDKVAELVQELQTTVRELDDTKDTLRVRQVELEQERAKIAALSILLEEGGGLGRSGIASPLNGHRIAADGGANRGDSPAAPSWFHPASFQPCTNHPPASAIAAEASLTAMSTTPVPQFTFLPPDHPES